MEQRLWNRTILVVDDEAPVRQLLKQGLQGKGYDVLTASNGEEALETLAQREVGAMLLDLKMPGLSGDQVLQRVKRDYPDTSVLMISAYGDMETVIQVMKEGAYDYIVKPFQFDDVVFRIEKALERRALVLQNRRHQQELEARVAEQSQRLKQQFAQLIQSLSREHATILALEEARGAGGRPPAELPEELRRPAGSVEEFARALLEVIRGGKLH